MNNIEKLKSLFAESNEMVRGMNSIFVFSNSNQVLEVDNNAEYEDMYNRYLRINNEITILLSSLTASATDTELE